MAHIPRFPLALDYSGKSGYNIADESSIHMIKTFTTTSSTTEDL